MEQLFLPKLKKDNLLQSINTFGGDIVYKLIYDEDAGYYRLVFVNV